MENDACGNRQSIANETMVQLNYVAERVTRLSNDIAAMLVPYCRISSKVTAPNSATSSVQAVPPYFEKLQSSISSMNHDLDAINEALELCEL